MKLRDFYARSGQFILGTTPVDAYELQRTIFADERKLREADATFERGRSGPGGGMEATPFAVSFIALAIMINGPRRRALETTWGYWHIETEGSVTGGWEGEAPEFKPCGLTGETMFGEALRTVVTRPELAERVTEIVVYRDLEEAIIRYDVGTTRFIGERDARRVQSMKNLGAMRAMAVLPGKGLALIARDLAEAN